MARSSIYPSSVTPGIPKLGPKPHGWIETTFGHVLEPVYRKANLRDDEKYQLVIAKRNRGGIVPRSVLCGRDIKTKTQFYVCENDFLIAKRQIVHGACGVVPLQLDGAIVSNEYVALNVKDDLWLDYLKYYCNSIHFQQTCFQSSIGVDVEKMIFKLDDWFKWHIYLPPLPEQRKIVAILSTWDEAITLIGRLIEVLQHRKKGLMQRLLTGDVRFPEFSEEWSECQLVDVCEFITKGSTPTTYGYDWVEQGVPFLRSECVSENGFITSGISYISEEAHQHMARSVVNSGDILITITGNIGRVAVYPESMPEGNINQHVARIRIIETTKVVPMYVYYLLSTYEYRKHYQRIVTGLAYPQISLKQVRETPLALPSIEQQRRVVTILSLCDQAIDSFQSYLEYLNQQRKGLMQRLLTGQIRVAV